MVRQFTAIYKKHGKKKTSTVPRPNKIYNFLAKKICRDLGIEPPKKK